MVATSWNTSRAISRSTSGRSRATVSAVARNLSYGGCTVLGGILRASQGVPGWAIGYGWNAPTTVSGDRGRGAHQRIGDQAGRRLRGSIPDPENAGRERVASVT